MLTTVAAILANPRHTGRQVWNRTKSSLLSIFATPHRLQDIQPGGFRHDLHRVTARPSSGVDFHVKWINANLQIASDIDDLP